MRDCGGSNTADQLTGASAKWSGCQWQALGITDSADCRLPPVARPTLHGNPCSSSSRSHAGQACLYVSLWTAGAASRSPAMGGPADNLRPRSVQSRGGRACLPAGPPLAAAPHQRYGMIVADVADDCTVRGRSANYRYYSLSTYNEIRESL